MFDVTIEEQTSQEAVDRINENILRAINSVKGVDRAEHTDSDIDEEEVEEE